MRDAEEYYDVVDREGAVIGSSSRSLLHKSPHLIHPVVHILVFNSRGDLLLQKRARTKDTAPGKWDTSVGGHCERGEDAGDAAVREMEEELGIRPEGLEKLYRYLFRNDRESELVTTFCCSCEAGFRPNPQEIDEVRFWDMEEIRAQRGREVFSSHFERELSEYLRYRGMQQAETV